MSRTNEVSHWLCAGCGELADPYLHYVSVGDGTWHTNCFPPDHPLAFCRASTREVEQPDYESSHRFRVRLGLEGTPQETQAEREGWEAECAVLSFMMRSMTSTPLHGLSSTAFHDWNHLHEE